MRLDTRGGTVVRMLTFVWLKDTAERVLKAFVQAVIAAWLLSPAYDYSAVRGFGLAGVVAALTVVKAALGALVPGVSPASWGARARWAADAGERLGTTFLEAFIAAWLLNPGFDLDAGRAAVLAGLAAALSLGTSLISAPVPSTISPASLVRGPVTPHPRVVQ